MLIDNERKIKLQNEADRENQKSIMSLFGYIEYRTPFFQTKKFRKLVDTFIHSSIPAKYNYYLTPMLTDEIRKCANEIIEKETEKIDRHVAYLPGDYKIIYDYIAKSGDKDLENGFEFAMYMKNKMKKIEATEIPITWKIAEERSGEICILDFDISNIDFLETCPVVTSGIIMTNENDIMGSVHLAHELAHALTDRNKGIITNLYHSEILSIYMELVAAYNIDKNNLLDIAIEDRLSSLKGDILSELNNQNVGYIEGESTYYIDSALYAFALFERYKEDRKKIRKEVNKTLSGDRTLEDTLSKLDITEEEGSHIMKKELKRRRK